MKSTIKKCSKCKKTEDKVKLVKYSKNLNKKTGEYTQYYRCNPCNSRKMKEYIHTEAGRNAVTRSVKKYEAKNKVKRKSWGIARCIPMTPCVVCGEKKTDRHHEDSTKPLEVVMLCRLHHKAAHRVGMQKLLEGV